MIYNNIYIVYSIFLPVYPFGSLRDAHTALAWVRLILTPLPIPRTIPAFTQDSRLHASPVVWENLNAVRENPHQEQRAEESNLSIFTENKLKLSFPACRLNAINVLSVGTAERLPSKC